MSKKIGIIVGSLRKGSFSRQIAKNLVALFPADFEGVFIPLEDIEMYNQDLDDENKTPENWTKFRAAVKDLDAILFVTPEYNRSVPAVIKNAIDVGSRPYGQSIWDKKPAAVVSVSPGAIAGFGANHHLRQSLVFLNMPTLQQPEAYIGNVTSFLEPDGSISNKDTLNFLQMIVDAFAAWVKKID